MMLKILIAVLLLFQSSHSYSQIIDNGRQFSKNRMILKTFDSKKKARKLLIGGASATLLSLIWFSNSENDEDIINDNIGGQAVLFILGTSSMIASIPFFISSHHEKRKRISAQIEIHKRNLINEVGHNFYGIEPRLKIKFAFSK